MRTRRRILPVLILLGVAVAVPAALPAQTTQVKMDDDAKKSVARALAWLAKQQHGDDGSWSDGGYSHNTAITSFALLAFLSQGNLPNQGMYGPEVAKGARFLLASSRQPDGYLIGARGGNMYCHGMATLALAELWGNTGDDSIKPVLKKAVDLIVRCQHKQEGGWRYEPAPTGADISVTIMQVMALRTAKNAGLHVPDHTLKNAIKYIERCYNAREGGFTYQPHSGAPGFARTAAGACVLFLAGEYKARQIPNAVEYLKRHFETHEHFWYGHYYAAHAMYQVGGKDWEAWYSRIRNLLLSMQSPDGSFSNRRFGGSSPGPVYQTSIAVIILSVPAHYLPIFQR